MPGTVIILIFIEFEGVTLLLDGGVSQMHEEVIYVLRVLARCLEFLGRETRQTFLINKHAERVHTVDQGVHSQIELKIVNQIRVVKIFLSDILFALLELNVLEPADQVNTSSLAQVHRFHDEDLVAVFLGFNVSKLVAEVCHLRGQNPGLREEVVVILEHFLHPCQIPTQVVLPGELIHPREVIYSLVVLKFRELVGENALSIIPKDVPISVLIISKFVP